MRYTMYLQKDLLQSVPKGLTFLIETAVSRPRCTTIAGIEALRHMSSSQRQRRSPSVAGATSVTRQSAAKSGLAALRRAGGKGALLHGIFNAEESHGGAPAPGGAPKIYQVFDTISLEVLAEGGDDEAEGGDDGAPTPELTFNVPPIRPKMRRPERRRTGPAWACVITLRENEEKGAGESLVRCRFCGAQFAADTERVLEHVLTVTTAPLEPLTLSVIRTDLLSAAAATLEDASSSAPTSAPAPVSSASPSPSGGTPVLAATEVPVPVCTADLADTSREDRATCLRWLKDWAVIQVIARVGLPVTRSVQEARRRAAAAEAHAILYKTPESCAVAAAEAAEAARMMKVAAIGDWQTQPKLLWSMRVPRSPEPGDCRAAQNPGTAAQPRTRGLPVG